jgi:phage shock protein A
MADSGFFGRLQNLWTGFWSLFVGNLEKDNPEVVYEAAINARKEQYKELKQAVSGIIVLRNKLATEHEEKKKQLVDVEAQLAVAVDQAADDVALVLIQRKDELSARIAELDQELEKAREEAEAAKGSIVSFQSEIEKLEREKASMLAKKQNAEARIKIQESLSGLSMQADIKALDNVREHIHRLQAEADVNTELGDADLHKKLEKIKQQTGSASARMQLDALKKAREASRAQQAEGAAAVKKSM